MIAIVQAFWRICLFKGGPESIPASNFLLTLVILLNALITFFAGWILQSALPTPESAQLTPEQIATLQSPLATLTRAVIGLVSTAVLVWGMLNLMGHAERVPRTLSAFFGTDAILKILTLLAVLVTLNTSSMLAEISIVALFFWKVATFGFILHRAMSIGVGLGVVAGLFILIFTFAVSQVAIGL